MRPMMENGNRALHALIEFENSSQWKPGSSITAKIILSQHPQAIVVPARTLVHRPSGIVVYQIEGNKVRERLVKTGIKQGHLIEIKSGINVSDTIVLDGAAWLTDGAEIEIQPGSDES